MRLNGSFAWDVIVYITNLIQFESLIAICDLGERGVRLLHTFHLQLILQNSWYQVKRV